MSCHIYHALSSYLISEVRELSNLELHLGLQKTSFMQSQLAQLLIFHLE